VFNGTRLEPGHYMSGAALAAGLEEAWNGSWFGRVADPVNVSNPNPFLITAVFCRLVLHRDVLPRALHAL